MMPIYVLIGIGLRLDCRPPLVLAEFFSCSYSLKPDLFNQSAMEDAGVSPCHPDTIAAGDLLPCERLLDAHSAGLGLGVRKDHLANA